MKSYCITIDMLYDYFFDIKKYSFKILNRLNRIMPKNEIYNIHFIGNIVVHFNRLKATPNFIFSLTLWVCISVIRIKYHQNTVYLSALTLRVNLHWNEIANNTTTTRIVSTQYICSVRKAWASLITHHLLRKPTIIPFL